MGEKGVMYVEKYQLDDKDKKIIEVLFDNSRYSIADISKKTGIRRDSVIYRLKKLQEKKVIIGFQPIVNAPSLGYPNIALVLLKSNLQDKEDKTDFVRKLKLKPEVIHIAITMGNFDYFLVILHKTHEELYKTMEEVKLIKPGYLVEYEILQVIEEPKFEDVLGLVLSQK